MDEFDLIPDSERTQARQLARRLREQRPVPGAAFRGDLRRSLMATTATGLSRRQRCGLALANAIGGGSLLAVAALSVAGVGPLAA